MPATIGYTVRRFQDSDGSWLYYGVVRDLVTGCGMWVGPVTEDGAAAEHEARELLRHYAAAPRCGRAGTEGGAVMVKQWKEWKS